MSQQRVDSTTGLIAALDDAAVAHIVVTAPLTGVPTFNLSPGRSLSGDGGAAGLTFLPGQDGVELTTDNRIEHLELTTDVGRRAVFNDTMVASLGRLQLRALRVTGNVRLLARDTVRSGHVEIAGLDIVAADARAWTDRPVGYGVEVVPGVLTLWNQQPDVAVRITADLTGLSAGRAGAPVRGSGVFVAGAGEDGGQLVVSRLETLEVHSDGGIAPGTADRISGGVFTVSGAVVARVGNLGAVTTYGANDMVLDNWGSVDHWQASGPITSYGPSAIGFVNFGTIDWLEVTAPLQTFGPGARGFNVYAGTVRVAEFDRIVTHADGAVGIQISQPVDRIVVRRGLETHGGTGPSLVKGVVIALPATALSIKPGGQVGEIDITGGIRTHGPAIAAMEIHGTIGALVVRGGLGGSGGGFDGI